MDKIIKKYSLVSAKNPLTGEALTRPVLAEQQTRSMTNVIEFAIKNNYMTGQVENLTGAVKGFFEALKQYCTEGQNVTLANWIRIFGVLSGTVGETGTLDAAKNKYRVRVSALNELSVPLDTFSWQRTDDSGVKVTVRNIAAKNGATVGVIEKAKAIVATGSNLVFDSALGDAITATYEADGESASLDLTPTSSGATALEIAWPSEFDQVASGSTIEFKFKMHGGVKDAPVQVITKKATLA